MIFLRTKLDLQNKTGYENDLSSQESLNLKEIASALLRFHQKPFIASISWGVTYLVVETWDLFKHEEVLSAVQIQ